MKRIFLMTNFTICKIKKMKMDKGFILPFAILISTLILSISLGVSTILVKEIFFSNLNRESSISYYAADAALECATSIDDNFIGEFGYGAFQYDDLYDATTTLTYVGTSRFSSSTFFSSTTVYCATVPIFDSNISHLSVADCDNDLFCDDNMGGYHGKNSTFDMRMDLGNGEYRCANVTVTKTPNGKRRIISRGYNTCNPGNTTLIERAIINTADSN